MEELWENEAGGVNSDAKDPRRQAWYQNGLSYYATVEATVDGMLGGYSQVHDLDIQSSRLFLKRYSKSRATAVDIGAGIGRVSCALLAPLFGTVDLVEPDRKFLDRAKELMPDKKLGRLINCGMQDFRPSVDSYDCIWLQWVFGHLVDDDAIRFLRRCGSALTNTGILCLKENNERGVFVMDKEDYCITRTDAHFRTLFKAAGLVVVGSAKQKRWPRELLPVTTYALRPRSLPVERQTTPIAEPKPQQDTTPIT